MISDIHVKLLNQFKTLMSVFEYPLNRMLKRTVRVEWTLWHLTERYRSRASLMTLSFIILWWMLNVGIAEVFELPRSGD
jgi:hypothetical protein